VNTLTCVAGPPDEGLRRHDLKVSIDGDRGGLRCARCGGHLDSVLLAMRVLKLSREGAVAWLQEAAV
jgi:hypothetical protein